MNVLLVNPNITMPIAVRTSPPLGIAYIAAISERMGHQVRVLDMQVDDTPLEQLVDEFPPDVIGITANTPQVKAAWAVAEKFKRLHPCPIMIGGPHPTVLPEETLRRSPIDVVARGEGEATWEEFLTVVARTPRHNSAALAEHLVGVKGISFRGPSGEFIHAPDRPPIRDLDSLPFPAYHLFKKEGYTSLQPTLDGGTARSFAMCTSRGCPYRCTYCSQSTFPEKWRARSVESVIAEFRHLIHDLGATEIGIVDDSFNIDRKRVAAICDALIESGLNTVPWLLINGIRSNLADRELLAKMKAAGCKRVAFAPETGNEYILQRINKKHTMKQVREAFANAKAVGMETIGFFMIGLPGDTEETMEETIRFAIELDPDVANFSMTTPFPGTILYNEVLERGRLLMDDWDDYIFLEGKARYELDVPAEVMERKWHEAYRRFYLRPRRILKTLARRSTWQQLPRLASMAAKLAMPYHPAPKRPSNVEVAC
ncbi:MAG: B12-binding domain-containing radical SAM protein [Chloroflexi bacterium]|nr:B12-binding domain-containing radical SAM protein [Chloroflexota bacterium]